MVAPRELSHHFFLPILTKNRSIAVRVQQQLLKMAASKSGTPGTNAGVPGAFPYGPGRLPGNYFAGPFPG